MRKNTKNIRRKKEKTLNLRFKKNKTGSNKGRNVDNLISF
jgi:hypothetical protein